MTSISEARASRRPMVSAPPLRAVGAYGLSAELIANLSRLRDMEPPSGFLDRTGWSRTVNDALLLARRGWAASALALGWSLHDIYGVGPRNSREFEGLAIWLGGRRLVLMDQHCAVTAGGALGNTYRRGSAFHRSRPDAQPVLLWQFGRGPVA
jgi:hypothetical protein